MSMLDRDGVAIYYEVHGTGPALLLTHGFAASRRDVRQSGRPLSESTHGDHVGPAWSRPQRLPNSIPRRTRPPSPSATSPPCSTRPVSTQRSSVGTRSAATCRSSSSSPTRAHDGPRADRHRARVPRDEGRDGWNAYADKIAASTNARAWPRSPTARSSTRRSPRRHRAGPRRPPRAQAARRSRDRVAAVDHGTDARGRRRGRRAVPRRSQYMAAKIPGAELAVIDGAGHAPPFATGRVQRRGARVPRPPGW